MFQVKTHKQTKIKYGITYPRNLGQYKSCNFALSEYQEKKREMFEEITTQGTIKFSKMEQT